MKTKFRSVFGFELPYPDSMSAKERGFWRYVLCFSELCWLVLLGILLLTALASVTGCTLLREPTAIMVPAPKTIETKVPVKVPCIAKEDVPVLPKLPSSTALALLSDFELILTIEQLRHELSAYAVKADAALAGCTK